jgi:D-alanine-D-alanine ligase-like ATP-grasp enzyme
VKAKKAKRESLLLGKLFQKLAPRIGATIHIEPEWGIVGQITFKNGKRSYFRYNTLDLNPVGASDIAVDKDYATYFMREMNYPTITGRTFFSDAWCTAIESDRDMNAAYRYAQEIGFPVIVKPNSGSQGTNVSTARNKRELYRALRAVFKHDRIALVQEKISGNDYRIVVLDEKIISVYQRIPLNVVGDGHSTILQLLKQKEQSFVASSRDTHIKLDDPRIVDKLAYEGLSLRSKLAHGTQVFLLDNANLSTGGGAVDVTEKIHSKFKKLAVKLTKDMGLRLCGVDIMIDGDVSDPSARHWIIEINAAPGLDHYVRSGKAQEKIVEDLYLEILKSMEH